LTVGAEPEDQETPSIFVYTLKVMKTKSNGNQSSSIRIASSWP
jgi:hypothetical protein